MIGIAKLLQKYYQDREKYEKNTSCCDIHLVLLKYYQIKTERNMKELLGERKVMSTLLTQGSSSTSNVLLKTVRVDRTGWIQTFMSTLLIQTHPALQKFYSRQRDAKLKLRNK